MIGEGTSPIYRYRAQEYLIAVLAGISIAHALTRINSVPGRVPLMSMGKFLVPLAIVFALAFISFIWRGPATRITWIGGLMLSVLGLTIGILSPLLVSSLYQLRPIYAFATFGAITIALITFSLAIWRIEWGFFFFLVSLPIVNRLKTVFITEIGPLVITVETIFLLVLIVIWLGRIDLRSVKFFRRSSLDLPIIGLLLAGSIASLVPLETITSLRLLFVGLIQPVIWYYLLINNLNNDEKVKIIVYGLIISMLIGVAVAFGKFFGNPISFQTLQSFRYQMASSFYNPGLFATTVLLVVPFTIYLFFSAKRKAEKLFAAGSFLLMSLTLILSFTQGVWLGFTVSLLAMIVLRKEVRKYLLTTFAALAIFMAIQPRVQDVALSILTRRLGSLSLSGGYSLSERIFAWLTALRIWENYPLTGVGLGSFYKLYPFFRPWQSSIVLEHAHNLFMTVLAEMGILGLISLVAIFLFALAKSWKDGSLLSAACASSLMGFIVSAATTGIAFSHSYIFAHMLLLFTVLALVERKGFASGDGEL